MNISQLIQININAVITYEPLRKEFLRIALLLLIPTVTAKHFPHDIFTRFALDAKLSLNVMLH